MQSKFWSETFDTTRGQMLSMIGVGFALGVTFVCALILFSY